MKKYFLLFLIVLLQQYTFAQSKMVGYFNKLSAERKGGITIKVKAGKATAESGTGKCKVTLDEKNGYLQIIDDGTGGGVYTVELAVFKTLKGKTYVVANSNVKSGEGNESKGMDFFDAVTMKDATYEIWPDISNVEDVLTNGVSKEDIEKYASTEYALCTLPKNGTTITYQVGFTALDQACNDNDVDAIALRKKLKSVKLIWNKKAGSFELKK
jgi:hypothetical protein